LRLPTEPMAGTRALRPPLTNPRHRGFVRVFDHVAMLRLASGWIKPYRSRGQARGVFSQRLDPVRIDLGVVLGVDAGRAGQLPTR
jgi:hypothetical protein